MCRIHYLHLRLKVESSQHRNYAILETVIYPHSIYKIQIIYLNIKLIVSLLGYSLLDTNLFQSAYNMLFNPYAISGQAVGRVQLFSIIPADS